MAIITIVPGIPKQGAFHIGSGPGLNTYDAVPHVYRSYLLSGHGTPDPAKSRRIEFKVPTDNAMVTFPSK